jgi:hypothetical protein
MIITMLWIIFLVINLVALFDILQMSSSEFKYWKALMKALTNAPEEVKVEVAEIRKQASEGMSQSQFGVLYIALALMLLGITLEGWIDYITPFRIFFSVLFLHYCGFEDLIYYLLSRWIKIPEWWWEEIIDGQQRETVNILGFRLPKYLSHLSETRKVLCVPVKPYWIILFAGKKVEIYRFILGVIVATGIVIGLCFI